MIHTRNPEYDEVFDSVVQNLFGIGLQLEHCIETTRDETVSEKLDASVRGLHDTISLIQKRGETYPQRQEEGTG